MKRVLILFILSLISINLAAQSTDLPIIKSSISRSSEYYFKDFHNTHVESGIAELILPVLIFWPLNPMFVAEGKKTYFGLTKEISVVFPSIRLRHLAFLGKLSAEYSYIFRDERQNHFRLSFEAGYPLSTGDFSAVILGVGPGYFTDFVGSGVSAHIALSVFVLVGERFAMNIYGKNRFTIAIQNDRSNIFDASLGIGFCFYPF
jgi:hypothetical protein